MLDRAVFPGSIHRLKDNQHGPAILRVEFVLQMPEQFDTLRQRLLRPRLVVSFETQRLARIDLLETKLRAVSNSKRFRILSGLLQEVFVGHKGPRSVAAIDSVHPNGVGPALMNDSYNKRTVCIQIKQDGIRKAF